MADVFPSVDRIDVWRSCTDRVVLRNAYVDIGLTLGNGLAAIWMAVRDDRVFRAASSWRDLRPVANAWLVQAAPRFDDTLARLGCTVAMPAPLMPLAA